MKIFILISVLLVGLTFAQNLATECNPDTCLLPDCRCSSLEIPGGLSVEDTPQFVLLTFDDAVNPLNAAYYRRAFADRKNRDGCPVASTFFISHEFTDYSLVHELYANAHEIALHSISHVTDLQYWSTASPQELSLEFGDQIDLMSYFSNISASVMQGMRLPFLQMSGDNSFMMMQNEGISYDLSWPSASFISPGMWPYSLNYLSEQDCVIGPCPTSAISDTWVIPMLTWRDLNDNVCSMVDGCQIIPTDVDELTSWMIRNFELSYLTNKAPFGFYVHSAWFSAVPDRLDAYIQFIDYLQTLDDVYLVGSVDVLNWTRDPKPISEMQDTTWSNCRQVQPESCTRLSCQLNHEGVERWMTICGEVCPEVYPWLGNPFGQSL